MFRDNEIIDNLQVKQDMNNIMIDLKKPVDLGPILDRPENIQSNNKHFNMMMMMPTLLRPKPN